MRRDRHQWTTRIAQPSVSAAGIPTVSQAGACHKKAMATAQLLVMRMKYIIGNWRDRA